MDFNDLRCENFEKTIAPRLRNPDLNNSTDLEEAIHLWTQD